VRIKHGRPLAPDALAVINPLFCSKVFFSIQYPVVLN